MPAPRLNALVGRKTRKGTRVSAGQLIGSLNDYYDTYLTVKANNAEYISEAINDAVIAALEEIGLVAEGAAKRLCPVDTGRLRNSITHAFLDDRTVIIGTNVEYAPYVHNGTRFWNGTGPRKAPKGGYQFLTKAVQNNAGRFNGIMRKHLQGS